MTQFRIGLDCLVVGLCFFSSSRGFHCRDASAAVPISRLSFDLNIISGSDWILKMTIYGPWAQLFEFEGEMDRWA